MSIGSTGGTAGSAAGSPLAQTQGPETQRIQQDAAERERRIVAAGKAEAAAGVPEPDGEDHEAEDRGGDGRRPWERTPANSVSPTDCPESSARPKDVTGMRGNLLDLDG